MGKKTMTNKQITQVPNFLFDALLPNLTESELKVILVVIRQTIGWFDKRTGKRKERDRISVGQFVKKTGLSKRNINNTIQSLVLKQLLEITGFKGNKLHMPYERKGKSYLFFSFIEPAHLTTSTSAKNVVEPAQKSDHNKNNYTKINNTKGASRFSGHISTLLQPKETLFSSLKT
jgi:hypothetical protein